MTVLLPCLGIIFLLLICSAFFSGSESALFSLDSYALDQLDEESRPADRSIRRLLREPRKLLATLLLGNEAVNVTISTVGLAALIGLREEHPGIPWWLNIVVITPILLIFGEILPKAIAVRAGLGWARLVAIPLRAFSLLIFPLRVVLQGIATLLLKPLRAAGKDPLPEILEESQFKALVSLGKEQGVLGSEEAELIHRVFDLTDTPVGEVMTPLSRVVAVATKARLSDLLEQIRDSRLARLPVYAGEINKIRGILLTKDLLRYAASGDTLDARQLETLLKPAYFVPPSKPCGALLQEFQQERGHMAIVLDEEGALAGVVTMQDLLDELFKPVGSEDETVRLGPRVERLAPGVFRVPARLEISDWNKMMIPPIPPGDSYNTVAGYIFHLFGRLPKKGESVRNEAWTFNVTGLDGNRLTWLTVKRREGGQPK